MLITKQELEKTLDLLQLEEFIHEGKRYRITGKIAPSLPDLGDPKLAARVVSFFADKDVVRTNEDETVFLVKDSKDPDDPGYVIIAKEISAEEEQKIVVEGKTYQVLATIIPMDLESELADQITRSLREPGVIRGFGIGVGEVKPIYIDNPKGRGFIAIVKEIEDEEQPVTED